MNTTPKAALTLTGAALLLLIASLPGCNESGSDIKVGGDLETGGGDAGATTAGDDAGSNTDAAVDGDGDANTDGDEVVPDTAPPTVVKKTPSEGATGVPVNANITATFSEAMDPATVTLLSFTVTAGLVTVVGTVSYAGTVATFNPQLDLAADTEFEVTISTGATDMAGIALAEEVTWTFETGDTQAKGPAPVDLGTAQNFVILSKAGIDSVPPSKITGDIGVSPIDSTAVTGFSLLTVDGSGTFATTAQVTGRVYAADYATPTPAALTAAISNQEGAYTDAAGRTNPGFTEHGAGDISGLTLVPGLYKWGTNLLISTDVTLEGGPNDVWVFQIAGGITQAPNTKVVLAGGALAKNIFWQAFGSVAIGTGAHMEGIILAKTGIALATGATLNGRLLAQTAVTLDQATVTEPE